MVTEEQREGLIAMTKIGSVWAMVGITSWADFAAALAAIYSLLMIADFAWKKFIRSWCIGMGWLPPDRRKTDRKPRKAPE